MSVIVVMTVIVPMVMGVIVTLIVRMGMPMPVGMRFVPVRPVPVVIVKDGFDAWRYRHI